MLAAVLLALVAVSPASAHGDEGHAYVSKIVRATNAQGIHAEAGAEGHMELTAPAGKVVVVHRAGSGPDLRFKTQNAGTTHAWHDQQLAKRSTHDPSVNWAVDGTVDGRPFSIEGTLEAVSAEGGVGYQWISYIAIGGFLCYLGFIVVTRVLAKR